MINPIRALFRVVLGFVALWFSFAVWLFAQLGMYSSTGQYASSYGFWATVSVLAGLAAWFLPLYIWVLDPIIGHIRRSRRARGLPPAGTVIFHRSDK